MFLPLAVSNLESTIIKIRSIKKPNNPKNILRLEPSLSTRGDQAIKEPCFIAPPFSPVPAQLPW